MCRDSWCGEFPLVSLCLSVCLSVCLHTLLTMVFSGQVVLVAGRGSLLHGHLPFLFRHGRIPQREYWIRHFLDRVVADHHAKVLHRAAPHIRQLNGGAGHGGICEGSACWEHSVVSYCQLIHTNICRDSYGDMIVGTRMPSGTKRRRRQRRLWATLR
jgi:hypothetical protein